MRRGYISEKERKVLTRELVNVVNQTLEQRNPKNCQTIIGKEAETLRLGFDDALVKWDLLRPERGNTSIHYTCQDDSFRTIYNHVIVEGNLSEEEIDELLGCLEDGGQFRPHKLWWPLIGIDDDQLDDDTLCVLKREWIQQTDEEITRASSAKQVLEEFRKLKGHWND